MAKNVLSQLHFKFDYPGMVNRESSNTDLTTPIFLGCLLRVAGRTVTIFLTGLIFNLFLPE